MIRTHAQLTKKRAYQVFKFVDGGPIMLRAAGAPGRKKGSAELWCMFRPAPVVGGVRSVSDDKWIKLEGAEVSEKLNQVIKFYGDQNFQEVMTRVAG